MQSESFSFLVPHTMADSVLEGVAAKTRKHNAHTSARSATMSHKSAKRAFTCSMWHAHTRARPHAAQLSDSSRFARDSRWEPQLTLRRRHCCNEGGLLSILAGWIDDRSSSTPNRAAQLSNQPYALIERAAAPIRRTTATNARRLVDHDAPRLRLGSLRPTKLPAAARRPQLRRHGHRHRQRRLGHERRRASQISQRAPPIKKAPENNKTHLRRMHFFPLAKPLAVIILLLLSGQQVGTGAVLPRMSSTRRGGPVQ